MPSIAELNIAIGANLSGLQKDLRQAERALKATGANMASLGQSLSQNVSLPMSVAGGFALAAAGQFEELRLAMQTTFVGAGRSISESNAELENLRQAAMAPGLDFEQAVRASIRLQNVGKSAEDARGIIVELANAVAMSGGSADDLGEVTRQFAQMTAKGRILQEDLSILQERMPVLSKVMKDTFGTVSADALRKAGVSADEFIGKITDALRQMPRVEGGIPNAFVNMRSAAQQLAVTVGEDLARSLDIKGVAERVAAGIDGLTARFRELDPETKKMIANFAVAAVSAGPVLLGLAGIVKASAALRVAWLTTSSAVLDGGKAIASGVSGMVAWVAEARKAFLALSLATQAFVGVAVVAAVFAAVSAFQSYNRELSASEKATASVADVQRRAANTVANERYEAEKLIGVLQNKNATRAEQTAALAKLKNISGEYFGKLTLETAATKDGTAALTAYTQALIGAATAKKAADRIAEINIRLADQKGIAEETSLAWYETMGMALASTNAAQLGANVAGVQAERTKKLTGDLEAERTELEKLVAQNAQFAKTTEVAAAATRPLGNGLDDLKDKAKATKDEFAGLDAVIAQLEAANEQAAKAAIGEIQRKNGAGVEPVQPSWEKDRPLNAPVLGDLPSAVSETSTAVSQQIGMVEQLARTWEDMGGTASLQADMFDAVSGSIQEMTASGEVNMGKMARAAVASALKVAKAYAVEAIFGAVKGALTNVPFPLNIAAAGVAAGVAGALLNGLTNRISAPKLAKGGLAYGPTMAVVGDNPGAKSNPEVIAPLDKLERIMGGDGGGGGYIAQTRVEYDALYIALQRAGQKRQRAGGK